MTFQKIAFCALLTMTTLQSYPYNEGFGDVRDKTSLEGHDPSFGYVGFGMSLINGAFGLSRSLPSTIPGSTPVEPNPITFQPIPDQDTTGVNAVMFSAHFGFMHALQNPLFTVGLFGGFNWSSLSQKWGTNVVTPENKSSGTVVRPASTTPVASALHVPLSMEAGAQMGLWAHPRFMPFIRVGWSLMRGGVNRTPWVDRYRYTYFNGIIAGAGIDFVMTQQSSLSLSFDWLGYGARSIRNFDTTKNVTIGDATWNYQTLLQSYVKPSYTRLMLSVKYVLPNNDAYDAL